MSFSLQESNQLRSRLILLTAGIRGYLYLKE
jgi:hypothetical protein